MSKPSDFNNDEQLILDLITVNKLLLKKACDALGTPVPVVLNEVSATAAYVIKRLSTDEAKGVINMHLVKMREATEIAKADIGSRNN